MKGIESYKSFGEFLTALRKEKRVTLREFCKRAFADPGNISRMERGAMSPPQDPDILKRYAEAIGLEDGSDYWFAFFDLAAADRGIIPKDLMTDREVVEMLPAFFRTLRGQKPSKEEMQKLIEKIKET